MDSNTRGHGMPIKNNWIIDDCVQERIYLLIVSPVRPCGLELCNSRFDLDIEENRTKKEE